MNALSVLVQLLEGPRTSSCHDPPHYLEFMVFEPSITFSLFLCSTSFSSMLNTQQEMFISCMFKNRIISFPYLEYAKKQTKTKQTNFLNKPQQSQAIYSGSMFHSIPSASARVFEKIVLPFSKSPNIIHYFFSRQISSYKK